MVTAQRPGIELDDVNKRRVIDMVSCGASRRTAAQRIGCAPSTITRAAQRDPLFGDQLFEAERALEREAINLVRKAAYESRYWRAAAWLLERKNPNDFGPQKSSPSTPDVPTTQQICQVFSAIIAEMPQEGADRVRAKFDAVFNPAEAEEATAETEDEAPEPPSPAPAPAQAAGVRKPQATPTIASASAKANAETGLKSKMLRDLWQNFQDNEPSSPGERAVADLLDHLNRIPTAVPEKPR